MRQPRWVALVLIAVLAGCTSATDDDALSPRPESSSTGAASDTPPPSWVVSVGDSYISGEGARWAGNTNRNARPIDALGPDAYDDRSGGETQPGCHRAEQSVATLGVDDVRGLNLACSGATTRSQRVGKRFTPGLDFYADGHGHRGQALALQSFASSHDVSHVIVSIGGNDFHYGSIVARCAGGFIGFGVERSECGMDADLQRVFSAANARAVTAEITRSLERVRQAMVRAGYDPSEWRLVVATYPAPLPPSDAVRYADDNDRYRAGGCPFFDADLDWANDTALATINASVSKAATSVTGANVTRLDLARAFDGHRLCEQGVSTFPASGLESWRTQRAAERLEWVNRVYFTFVPWQVQESLHPNYWGMRAQQACVREVVEDGDENAVRCVNTGRLNEDGSPEMRLVR